MGVIEDLREVLQDLVTPELKSLVVRVDALERKMDARFSDIQQAIMAADLRSEQRNRDLVQSLDFDRRLTQIEDGIFAQADKVVLVANFASWVLFKQVRQTIRERDANHTLPIVHDHCGVTGASDSSPNLRHV